MSEISAKSYEIRRSSIAGDGVFAVRTIVAGECIGTAFKVLKHTKDPDRDIGRTVLGEKMNHADAPNVELMKKGDVFLCVALRAITVGEELLIDYRAIPWEGKLEF